MQNGEEELGQSVFSGVLTSMHRFSGLSPGKSVSFIKMRSCVFQSAGFLSLPPGQGGRKQEGFLGSPMKKLMKDLLPTGDAFSAMPLGGGGFVFHLFMNF